MQCTDWFLNVEYYSNNNTIIGEDKKEPRDINEQLKTDKNGT